MNKAVFLDRDGVINEMLFNESTKEFEPPHNVEDLKLYDFVIESLKEISKSGFKLFLISNQPDFAKGKATLNDIQAVHNELHKILTSSGIKFERYYYCYHHPQGINPDFTKECDCRKPKPFFILNAVDEFSIDKEQSWMVGDRSTDILCGQNAGVKTILIKNDYYNNNTDIYPDFEVYNLKEACELIINFKN